MASRQQRSARRQGSGTADGTSERLTYRIELWEGDTVNRLLARAGNANLARAIFTAAAAEYPGRAIVLCRGSRIIARRTGEGASAEDDE